MEPERLHFSWISSAESTKFVTVAKAVTEAVRKVGPNLHFVKQPWLEKELVQTPEEQNV